MKSCRYCKKFSITENICKHHGSIIIDKTVAMYCTKYIDKRVLNKEKAKCIECNKINRYGWCSSKRRCFTEDEQKKERSCIRFSKRFYKKPKRFDKHK